MKDGLWYDDDEFLHRIEKVSSVKNIESKNHIGIHQYHDGGSKENRFWDNFMTLRNKNKKIYQQSLTLNETYLEISDNYNYKLPVLLVLNDYQKGGLESMRPITRIFHSRIRVFNKSSKNHKIRIRRNS